LAAVAIPLTGAVAGAGAAGWEATGVSAGAEAADAVAPVTFSL
jgi:hypothetical protein